MMSPKGYSEVLAHNTIATLVEFYATLLAEAGRREQLYKSQLAELNAVVEKHGKMIVELTDALRKQSPTEGVSHEGVPGDGGARPVVPCGEEKRVKKHVFFGVADDLSE